MQRDAGVPSTLVSVVEALLILAVVGAQALRKQAALTATTLPLPRRET
jgi:hypothetical protein